MGNEWGYWQNGNGTGSYGYAQKTGLGDYVMGGQVVFPSR